MTIPEKINIHFPQWIHVNGKTAIVFVNNISNRSEICWQELNTNHRLTGPIRTIYKSSNLIFFPLSCGTFQNSILIVMNDVKTRLHILRSDDAGKTWTTARILPDKESIFVPTLVIDTAGTAHLFSHMEYNGKFTLYLTQSIDQGKTWSPPRPILQNIENRDAKNRGDFFPSVVCRNDSIYLALQNRSGGGEEIINDELFLLHSPDRGRTWSLPKRLTVNRFDDIRPTLIFTPARPEETNQNGKLFLFWEKNISNTWEIHSRMGEIQDNKEILWKDEKQIIHTKNNTHWPMPINDNGSLALFWHEYKGKNDHVMYMGIDSNTGEKKGVEIQLSDNHRNNKKPSAIKIKNDILVAWQSEEKKTKSSYIIIRIPDRYILPPDLYSSTHEDGVASRERMVRFAVKPMPDISGIRGFATIFDQNPFSEPDIMNIESTNFSTALHLVADGTYYFHIKVIDNAGNWSETKRFKLILDTRGPEITSIESPDFADGWGSFKTAGDFYINSRDEDKIQGYSYTISKTKENPPNRINSTTNRLDISGLPVGSHFLNVKCVDMAGNWGFPQSFNIIVKGDDIRPTKPDVSSLTIPGYTVTSNNSIEFIWSSYDQFGIKGYSWILTKDPNENPPKQIRIRTNQIKITKIRNGDWFFKVQSVDPSGNWSTNGMFPFSVYRDEKGPTISNLMISEPIEQINKKTNLKTIPSLSFTWSATDENGISRHEYSFNKNTRGKTTNFQVIFTNFVIFTNLPRDEYLFIVKSVDNKENESIPLSMPLSLTLKKKKVEKSGDFIYTVKFRDTLSGIIRKTLQTTLQNNKNYWEDIAWYNRIGDVDMIRIDQIIRFPAIDISEIGNKEKEYLAAVYLGDPGRADDIIFVNANKKRIILRDKYFLRHGKLKPAGH